jgi:isoleucyl-tRNA synthetase
LANLSDFDYQQNDNLEFDDVDNFILGQLQKNIKIINECYEKYEFNNIIKIINNHVIELSA